MSNVSSFPNLVTRARMSIVSHLTTVEDPTVAHSLRMALLWINTAGDAERVGDIVAAKLHLGNAQAHLQIASAAHQMDLVSPLTSLRKVA
jgi:hypothetical protein